ncbi:uncharacterized protein Fot_29808 [Forsythia ovata]|uniref:Uncharacterized protein n=1 Tax=Forsythia ovata TaxID=205694 RepID=A0ABD1TSX0_9LAMI
MEGDEACELCKRKLSDPDRYRFCSLACKMQASCEKKNRVKPHVATRIKAKGKNEVEETAKPNMRKRSRKGVPYSRRRDSRLQLAHAARGDSLQWCVRPIHRDGDGA